MNTLSQARPRTRRSRWRKILAWTLSVIAALAVILFIALRALTYGPLEEARQALVSDEVVAVSKLAAGYRFEPASGEAVQPNIVFYPGGLVDPVGYSTFASKLAAAGHRVYIADMPLELAIFGQNKADAFLKERPDESFVIGGHSLGGVFAARYAKEHADRIEGVYFLASYADKGGSLSGTDLRALQITATKDAILNLQSWEEAKPNLPVDTTYIEIEGGNHGQFGTYGMQKGDNEAALSADEQQQAVADAIVSWIEEVSND